MNKNFFQIIRAGINTTFQDQGRKNLYHIGIPFSGAMDNRNFLIANKLVGNDLNYPVLEFAYQGPLLKYSGKKINIAITGDVNFTIKNNNTLINGNCYQTYILEDGDELDIISTNKSVYGYLSVSGKFDLKYQWLSCSVNTKANIGANDGKKLEINQKINLLNINQNLNVKKLNYLTSSHGVSGLRFTALPSSVSMCTSSLKLSSTRTSISSNVTAHGPPIFRFMRSPADTP